MALSIFIHASLNGDAWSGEGLEGLGVAKSFFGEGAPPQGCANIAGTWSESVRTTGTYTETIPGQKPTTQEVDNTVEDGDPLTFEQNGCELVAVFLSGLRQGGQIEGNRVTLDPLTLESTVAPGCRRVLNAVGSVGDVQGDEMTLDNDVRIETTCADGYSDLALYHTFTILRRL